MAKNNEISDTSKGQFILEDDSMAKPLADIISKRIETYNPKRRQKLTEIKANIAYLVGEQNIMQVGDNIVPIERERAIQSVYNAILPAVQKDVSVGTSIAPVVDVVPSGTDDDDKATAIAGQKILSYIRRKSGKDLKRGEAILWYDISGIGWRKTYWDPNAHVVGINPAETDEDGNPNPAHIPDMEVGEAIVEGEVEVVCVPTNQLIYDYREPNPRKMEWIIQCDRKSAAWVLDRLGPEVYTKLASKFNITNKESEFEAAIDSGFSRLFGGASSAEQRTVTSGNSSGIDVKLDSDKSIDYYEYWHKPTKSNPAGNYAVMLGDQVVFHTPYPLDSYPHGELPYTPDAPMTVATATMGGICRVSQARPLQRELNRLRSQIAENNDVMGNAVFMAPRQAKIRYTTLDNKAGNLIEYDGPVGKPSREPGVPMSGQIFNYLYETKLGIDEIFAFHAPTRGQAPKNIDSGKGIIALQNQDTKHLGPIVASFEESDERIAYQALTLAMTNYPENKTINIVGSDYEWTVFEIDRNQLQGKFNVLVKPGSSMPLDKNAEKQEMFALWQSGLLGDPQDPSLRVWVMEQMHMGNADKILQKHSKQRNFAVKEFAAAKKNLAKIAEMNVDGMDKEQLARMIEQVTYVPPINPFDDHMIHIEAHNEFAIDNYWDFRAMASPIVEDFIRGLQDHIMAHQMIVQNIQEQSFQKQLRAQMMVKGTTMEQIALKRMNFDKDGKQIKKVTNEKGK